MIRTMLFMWTTLIFLNLISTVTLIAVNIDDIDHPKQVPDLRYALHVQISEVLQHLDELQKIATANNGNRAVKTAGFNGTLDYITDYLAANTNFKVTRRFFNLRSFQLVRNPTFSTTVDGVVTTHVYSVSLALAEYYHVQYSTSIDLTSETLLTAIPNVGCTDADWLAASPAPAGLVAIVKRGVCTFETKAILASKYKVAALLIYNDGTSSSNIRPISISLGQHNTVPALFLSYNLGQSLVNAALDPLKVATTRITIVTDSAVNPVGNICADTLTGDPTQTIIVGSHSDSVTAGPGINDNGSGTAANLALAATLSRLLQTPDYDPYRYRIRFCWWGAEELGLIGANYHVVEARKTNEIGERITDHLVNINLDMVGSPNFIFGIYDGKTASSSTPAVAIPGSNKMTTLFQDWFVQNGLPWDYTSFDGRSDYGPFLASGVVAGGLFTGADALKTAEQRNRYETALGPGMGGTSGQRQDQCYHAACDRTSNINQFALEKMLQASAYAIENLGQQPDLKAFLYPAKQIEELRRKTSPPSYEYNSINEYFGLPYY